MPSLKNRWAIAVILLLAAIVLSYVFLIRPWEMRWGATDEEVSMALPGDPWAQKPGDPPAHNVVSVSTRAITIHAPASRIWQWMVQIGVGRGGWYSHEWLENLFATGMRNTDGIQPELQHVQVGDHWLFTGLGNAAEVSLVDPGRTIVLNGWTLYLRPIDAQTTRLIVRYPMHADEFINAPLSFSIFETAHFVMETGMMMGIKERAERTR